MVASLASGGPPNANRPRGACELSPAGGTRQKLIISLISYDSYDLILFIIVKR